MKLPVISTKTVLKRKQYLIQMLPKTCSHDGAALLATAMIATIVIVAPIVAINCNHHQIKEQWNHDPHLKNKLMVLLTCYNKVFHLHLLKALPGTISLSSAKSRQMKASDK